LLVLSERELIRLLTDRANKNIIYPPGILSALLRNKRKKIKIIYQAKQTKPFISIAS